jgi:hypothetical protein
MTEEDGEDGSTDPDPAVDTDADPFEELGPADREGDPFEDFGAAPEDNGASEHAAETDADPDPWVPPGNDDREDASEWRGPTDEGDPTPEPDASEGTDSAPTDPLGEDQGSAAVNRDDVDPFEEMDAPSEDPFAGEAGDVFERSEVGPADPDEIWESVVSDTPDQAGEMPETERYSEVSKHRFCEQCEFFSEPPAASCTHETAEIMEFLDMETVRVRDCPIVAEKRALEDET